MIFNTTTSKPLTLVGGFQNEISSDLAGKIESVLRKTNLNTHSMLCSYTMPYDNLLYFEYTREFSCAYSHVHIGTKIPKLVVSERQKNTRFVEHAARVDPTVDPVPMDHN